MQQRLAVILSFCLLWVSLGATKSINIWDDTPDHRAVDLYPYTLTDSPHRLAVIICPGGSYFWQDINNEGHQVATWLNQNGISAFVLKYRTAGVWAFITHYRNWWRGTRYPDAHNDLLKAVDYIKKHADQYNVSPDSIGFMGFSAGGHLTMETTENGANPLFVAAIYPVVTMVRDFTHPRSKRALMGESRLNDLALADTLSVERHVPAYCPPVFLVNCLDDNVVDYRNSVVLDSALTAQKVPHLYLQYPTGGHGFGVSDTKGSVQSRQWKNEFLTWIEQLFFTHGE
ncbi:MAG: alpha/beta hydrolase [Muribaculaceae bacterium]|nr:alpha/beta hydrolase [Muribaculaceae bacterium]